MPFGESSPKPPPITQAKVGSRAEEQNTPSPLLIACQKSYSLLICTLISESRSISNPEKRWVYTINLKKIQVPNLKKSQGLQILKFF